MQNKKKLCVFHTSLLYITDKFHVSFTLHIYVTSKDTAYILSLKETKLF